MNPQFINTTNVDNNSDNTTETGSQQCMSDSVAETSCLGLGDEYLPKGHITTHPFSLTPEELSGLLKGGQKFGENSETPEPLSNKDKRGCVENSTQLFQDKSIDSSQWPESPKFISQTPEPLSEKDKRGCVENSTQLFPCKSIGGSGWLNKSTKLKSTKRGPVEYPRVKDHKRDPNNCSHWYWYYRWQKKGKNGKPLYKGDGSPVTECIYCPQKKVRVVERAITAKLPHGKILEIIKGDNSPPPPT